MRRVLLIGNCQVAELVKPLRRLVADTAFESFQVHRSHTDGYDEVHRSLAGFDQVFSMPLRDLFGPLSRSVLSNDFDHVRFFTNLRFDGLYPDFTHIGPMRARVQGPLGNYHSRIAFHAFMAGLDVARTVRLFNSDTYDLAGYYESFEQHRAAFLERDLANDVAVGSELLERARATRMLLTYNHPTKAGLMLQAKGIVASLGVAAAAGAATDFHNALEDGPGLPIYPEIAARLNISYRDRYLFKTASHTDVGGIELDLEQFVLQEFLAFEQVGKAALLATAAWSDRGRFRDMLG